MEWGETTRPCEVRDGSSVAYPGRGVRSSWSGRRETPAEESATWKEPPPLPPGQIAATTLTGPAGLLRREMEESGAGTAAAAASSMLPWFGI
jgi:hypothetical protein